MTTRPTLTQCANTVASLRDELALQGADAHVIGALDALEKRLRPGRRTGRPRTADRERIRSLYAGGMKGPAIARELGIAHASVYRALKAE